MCFDPSMDISITENGLIKISDILSGEDEDYLISTDTEKRLLNIKTVLDVYYKRYTVLEELTNAN